MTRTQTPRFDDPTMLRKLVSRTHRDAGGDDELFVFANALRESLLAGELLPTKESETVLRCSDCNRRGSSTRHSYKTEADSKDRVPFVADASFDQLTSLALERAGIVSEIYGELLLLLRDCVFMADMERQQHRGASYKQLAYVAHLAKMSKPERTGWYRVAESIPLGDRHASHLISRLKGSESA